MGRARKQKTRDRNKNSLPQTPEKDIATSDEDLKWAKEIDGKYDERLTKRKSIMLKGEALCSCGAANRSFYDFMGQPY
ncbi:YfhD family protein [Anaerobacillus sp. HL2]|nr:YfhD family protein [Anaerobacillus sp. HL2]